MKTIAAFTVSLVVAGTLLAQDAKISNPKVNYQGFLRDAQKVAELRRERLVTEDQFLKHASEPGTVIFDARTKDKFEMLHVKGARHLSLTDVTADTLASVIPSKGTRVLIYCNNNFLNEPVAFASKRAEASLNIYTFNTLYTYGYTNVYELGPLVDIRKSKLPMEGTRAAKIPEKK